MKKTAIFLIVFYLFLLSPSMSSAVTVGNYEFYRGYSRLVTLMRLGPPSDRMIIGVIRSSTSEIFIEAWTYKIDWYGVEQLFRFEFWGDYLNKVTFLRFSYGPEGENGS